MLSARSQFGHAVRISGSSSFTIDYRAKLWVVDMTTTNRTVTLPSVIHPLSILGADVFAIANDGSNNFNLRDFEGTNPIFTSATVPIGKVALISSYLGAGLVWVYSLYNWEHG